MDDVSTDGANAAKAARWAEGCRRHKAISRLVVPGFDDMVHRFGAKAVMSRRPFLPIALRVPLLAGVAIAMRDPAQTISRHAHPRPLPWQPALHRNRGRARKGIRKSSLTLTANLRLGPASVSSQNAQRREKSRSLMPRCQATPATPRREPCRARAQ